jgi:tetratricopeptide (TPR) repeat protein
MLSKLATTSSHPAALILLLGLAVSASIAQAPNHVTSLVREGQSALDAGDFDRATRSFEQARQLSPENLAVNRGLLLSYLQSARLAEAKSLGESAVSRWPNDPQFHHWLGLAYFKDGQNAKALETLKRSESLDSSQFDIHFDVALVLLSLDQYSEAAHELEEAVKLDPKAALAHLLLGRAYQNTNRTVQAVEQFQTALRLQPGIPLGHYHLGFAYASLGRNQEAIAEYEKEMVRSPNNAAVLYQLGHRLLEAGDLSSAIAHLKKAAQLDSLNSDVSYDLGKALLQQGDAAGAVIALRRAIALKPADPSPHFQLEGWRQARSSEIQAAMVEVVVRQLWVDGYRSVACGLFANDICPPVQARSGIAYVPAHQKCARVFDRLRRRDESCRHRLPPHLRRTREALHHGIDVRRRCRLRLRQRRLAGHLSREWLDPGGLTNGKVSRQQALPQQS